MNYTPLHPHRSTHCLYVDVLWRWCVWCLLDSSRVIPAGCSGMSSDLSIKAGPEFPISLRFEFGADSLIWTPPFQYVEPGVHLANCANYPQTTKTTYGVQPSLWICHSNPWTHDWETKSRTAESDHFLPEILHPIHSKMGDLLDELFQRSTYRINNGNWCLLWKFPNQSY